MKEMKASGIHTREIQKVVESRQYRESKTWTLSAYRSSAERI